MTFSSIEHGSEAYQQELALRNVVLREPLGLDIMEDDLSKESNQWHFGLFENDKLIACVIAVPHLEKEAQLRQMAVTQTYQRKGHGREIILLVEKHLVQKGIKNLILHARVEVLDFYLKLGYSPVGELFIEVGIPHQKMLKALT